MQEAGPYLPAGISAQVSFQGHPTSLLRDFFLFAMFLFFVLNTIGEAANVFFTMEKLDTETCQVKKKTELEFLDDGVCSQSIRPPCLRGSIAVVNSTANATCTPPLREVRAGPLAGRN